MGRHSRRRSRRPDLSEEREKSRKRSRRSSSDSKRRLERVEKLLEELITQKETNAMQSPSMVQQCMDQPQIQNHIPEGTPSPANKLITFQQSTDDLQTSQLRENLPMMQPRMENDLRVSQPRDVQLMTQTRITDDRETSQPRNDQLRTQQNNSSEPQTSHTPLHEWTPPQHQRRAASPVQLQQQSCRESEDGGMLIENQGTPLALSNLNHFIPTPYCSVNTEPQVQLDKANRTEKSLPNSISPLDVHSSVRYIGKPDNIPKFDGNTNTLSVHAWVHRLELLAKIYGWDEKTLIYHMTTNLTGNALLWFGHLQDIDVTWEEWKKRLAEVFPASRGLAAKLHDFVTSDFAQGIVAMSGAKLLIENCTFDNFYSAIVVHKGAQVELRNCRIKNCGVGIQMYGGAQVALTHCALSGCTEHAVRCELGARTDTGGVEGLTMHQCSIGSGDLQKEILVVHQDGHLL